jgi:hypothetical protein
MWGCLVDGASRHDEQGSSSGSLTRQCEFCYQELSEKFLFCPYCGKRIDARGRQSVKWYHSRRAVVIGLLTLGPFALPMVWSNPRYSGLTKTTLTVLTLGVTAALVVVLVILLAWVVAEYRQVIDLY